MPAVESVEIRESQSNLRGATLDPEGNYQTVRLTGEPNTFWHLEFEKAWQSEGDGEHTVSVEEDSLLVRGPCVEKLDSTLRIRFMEALRKCVNITNERVRKV